jgi:ribose transport system ATP-binding protein
VRYLKEHETAVELVDITKNFPGVRALDGVSLTLKKGEVHGLIGENGAGKSTLIKTLTGVHKPDQGKILCEGKEVVFSGPLDAKKKGIACVYQELNIVAELNATDNMFMGNMKKKGNSFLLDYGYMNKKTKEVMKSMNQDIDLTKICGNMGMGQLQMIEIGKSILQEAKVLILDEPTSSLGEQETKELFKTVNLLKEQGMAILFVSHKLEEIFELCDVVTVMRDGKHVVTMDTDQMTQDDLITYMVGRSLDNLYPKVNAPKGDVAMEVRHLSRRGVYHDISFSVRKGEVLGFAGLVGAGRTEVFRGIFAADPVDDGEIYINGQQCRIKSPGDAIKNKIAFLTEDRKGQGLVLDESISKNIALVNMLQLSKGIFVDDKKLREQAEHTVEKLRIKTDSIEKKSGDLSGGNQQKVVIGKWINTDAEVFIFDEPTRGIDVGAKIEVYNIINDLVKEGKAVVMISSELPEILGMCDRVIVMRSGRITGEIDRESEDFNQESIMRAAWEV